MRFAALLLAIAFACACLVGTAQAAPSPVAFWPLDETAGSVAHDAAGSHDGTFSGAVTPGVAGAPQNGNPAARFDGGTVSVPYSAALNPDAYTVEAWVNPSLVNVTQDSGSAARPIVCSRDGAGLHGWMLYQDNYVGHPQFAFVVGADSSRRYVYDDSGDVEQANRWYHVVGSFDGANLHLYVNGTEVTSAQLNDGGGSAVLPNASFPLQIGGCNGGTETWNGAIQDVSLYASALDAGTIAGQASGGTPPPPGTCTGDRCPQSAGPQRPLIFIPGIMGSVLRACGFGTTPWPTAITDESLLPFLAVNDQNCLEPADVMRSFFYIQTAHLYDRTISELGKHGYVENENLFVCPVDWRQSAEALWQDVFNNCAQHALAETHAANVDVLAHSQGGLIAGLLIKHSQGLVHRLVTMGTPNLGAEKALDMYEWHHECVLKQIWRVCPADPPAKELQKVIATMPGVFELLPSPLYARAVAPPLLLPGKSATAYSTLEDFLAQKYDRLKVIDAEGMHADLDALHPSVPMLRIVGNNQSTLYQVKVSRVKECSVRGGCVMRTHVDFHWSKLGDGTVPLNSADLKNDRNGFDHRNGVANRYFDLNHMALAQNDASITAAVKFFRTANPPHALRLFSAADDDDGVLPGTAEPQATTPSLQIEVMGSASTTVSSLTGAAIPDAGRVDGTDSFVLDDPGAYSANIQPSEEAPLFVIVRRFADGPQSESLFYVPNAVPGTPLTLAATSDQTLDTLRLEGGGVQYAPIATTDGSSEETDVTPPTTLAGSTLSGPGVATLELLARDEAGGSGVASSYVQIGDDAPVQYAGPMTVPLYSNVRYWSVDRAGNAEDAQFIVADDVPNFIELAQPLNVPAHLQRTIWPTGDEDWFSFAADGASTYMLNVSGQRTLELHNADGSLVQPPQQSAVKFAPPAGTYYIRITGPAMLTPLYNFQLRRIGKPS